MIVRTPGRRAMKARRPLRPSSLALALALAGAASPAFALGCKYDRTGDNVVLSRNPAEASGSQSYYGYGSSQPRVEFDATGLDRLEVNACQLDGIAHGTLVTDRPIEIVYDNSAIKGSSTSAGPHDTFIDLSRRFVNPASGSSTHNRLVVNGGLLLSTTGTDGPVPFDVVFNGGVFGGAGSLLRFDPAGRIRDNDTLTVNGGLLLNWAWLGGGADIVNVTGGTVDSYAPIYGDGGTFRMAELNTFGNRFDDTFTFTGGRVGEVHGDSGDYESARDANGQYTQDGRPAGNDRFILDGGWVRYMMGDDGDDRLDLKGNSSLYEFRGGYGSDTVDVAAGASLDHVYAFNGDAGNPFGSGYLDRASDADTIRFHGQQFEADSTDDHGCATVANGCHKHVDILGFERVELLDGSRLSIYDRGGSDGAAFGDVVGHTVVFIDGTSALSARRSTAQYQQAPRLIGSVINNGTVDLGQDAPGDMLWVYGDWSGNGRVAMSTVLADDKSATDLLRIDGNATGRTVLDIAQAAGSVGAQTVDGILVVDTRGTSTNDAFVLAAPITTANGLWQYRLEKATSGANAGKFVLTSSVPAQNPPTTPPPTTPPPTTPPGGTTPPGTGTPGPSDGNARLLAPVVATVATSGVAAQSLVVDGLADADARALATRGVADANRGDAPVWMRVRGDRLRTHGDRFGEDLRRLSLHAGADLQRDDRAVRGVMARVAQADGEAEDRLRPTLAGFATTLSSDVGDMRLRAYTVGGYQTLQLGNGLEWDVTAEGGKLTARIAPDDGRVVHTGGWAAALSTTLTRPVTAGGLAWRPQAQLVAAHTSLGGMDGSVSSGRLTQNPLRVRLGTNVTTAGDAATRFYATANLWRDLRDVNDAVFRGGSDATSVRATVARSWAELGVGLAHASGKATWHIDLRGERGLGAGDRNGVAAQAGLDLRW